jgi:hypothetical protein
MVVPCMVVPCMVVPCMVVPWRSAKRRIQPAPSTITQPSRACILVSSSSNGADRARRHHRASERRKPAPSSASKIQTARTARSFDNLFAIALPYRHCGGANLCLVRSRRMSHAKSSRPLWRSRGALSRLIEVRFASGRQTGPAHAASGCRRRDNSQTSPKVHRRRAADGKTHARL